MQRKLVQQLNRNAVEKEQILLRADDDQHQALPKATQRVLFAQQMEAHYVDFQGQLKYEYEMQFDDSRYFFFSEARLPWPFRVWNFPFASRRRLQAPEQQGVIP